MAVSLPSNSCTACAGRTQTQDHAGVYVYGVGGGGGGLLDQ